MITVATLILGLALGTVMILASVYVFLKHRDFSLGGSVLTLVGTVLLGLSIWQSVELSIGPTGGFTAKFSQDLGATAADIKGKIAQIELNLQDVTEDITSLRNTLPGARLSPEAAEVRVAREKVFQENSKFSVLVFHKPRNEIFARKIEEALLSDGYKSSSTATELTESKKQFPSRHAWVIYTERGKDKLKNVEAVLAKLSLDIKLHVEPRAVELRRGDIQILLF